MPFFMIILSIIILILSVIIHEVSHGYMADWLGDPTARMSGRLTLNPIPHIDLYGSIIVPLITSLFGFTFGWAKPVPYNPYNLKNKRQGEILIAMAGPLSNLLLALIFSVVIRISGVTDINSPFLIVVSYIVVINLVLAIFNLIPLPPLDGSKLFLALMPNQYGRARFVMERYGAVFSFIVAIILWQLIWPIIPAIFGVLTGLQ